MNEAAEELRPLTAREKQVLILVCKGLKHKEMSKHLELSPKTVETYRCRIKKRLNMTLIEAAVLAAKAGWV